MLVCPELVSILVFTFSVMLAKRYSFYHFFLHVLILTALKHGEVKAYESDFRREDGMNAMALGFESSASVSCLRWISFSSVKIRAH